MDRLEDHRELVQLCIDDDRIAQERLYRMFADKMFSIALNYSDSEDEACDILQEGFIRVFRKLNQFNFTGSLEGWIRRIVVNTAIEFYRKKSTERENLKVYKNFIDDKIENIISNINAQEIIKMVNELPRKAAMVLKLYSIEGYSHKEIATQMGISTSTSKSQLNRARYLLSQAIVKENERR